MEERLAELPNGWVGARLGDIIRIIDYRGRTPPYSDSGIPHLRSSNIKNGKLIWSELRYVSEETYHKYMTRGLPEEGDVLFTTEAPFGEVALTPNEKFSLAQRIMILRPPKDLFVPKFLLYQIMDNRFQARLKGKLTGTTVTGVSSRNFKPLELIIPPLPEQHRILAKIEELFTKLDAGVEALMKIKAQVKRYRQAVLKYAFEGKLTQEWREANKGKIEPASVLLERIKEERKKDAKRKYKELPPIDTSYLPELPEGWEWTRVGEIARMVQYGTSEKAGDDSTGIPVIRMGNIYDGKIIFGNLKYFPKGWSQVNDFILQGGDILFNRTNSMELVGKTAVYKDNYPKAVFASYLIRVRVNNDFYIPEMMSFFINSFYGRKYIASVVSQQVGQANVNGTKLSLMPIPLPPLSEQQRIVEEIESRLSIADNLEKVAEQSLKQSEGLRQSILKQAFDGKLVPQDPTDEPAEKLLERIREEKIKQEAENKREKKHKSKKTRQMELI